MGLKHGHNQQQYETVATGRLLASTLAVRNTSSDAKARRTIGISLSGIPPTAGFVGKLYLFGAAVQSGHVLLAVIGVLNSAVSVFYYLRLMVLMYMRDEQETLPAIRIPIALALCLLIAAVGTLGPGIWPAGLIDAAREGMRALFS
jgi:NADH:ubiquinone oxidoreductase subunit 2 (subunit N)